MVRWAASMTQTMGDAQGLQVQRSIVLRGPGPVPVVLS